MSSFFTCIRVSTHWSMETNQPPNYINVDQFTSSRSLSVCQVGELELAETVWFVCGISHLWSLRTNWNTSEKGPPSESFVLSCPVGLYFPVFSSLDKYNLGNLEKLDWRRQQCWHWWLLLEKLSLIDWCIWIKFWIIISFWIPGGSGRLILFPDRRTSSTAHCHVKYFIYSE